VKIEKGFARPQRGLTLLELLIAIALTALLFGFAAPNAVSILDQSRMTAHVNRMSSVLQLTRFEAINHSYIASLCPSPDLSTCNIHDWNLPKILFADSNHNGVRDSDEPLIHATNETPKGLRVTGPKRIIRFYEDGTIGSPSTILICPERPRPELNRALFVSLQGRVRLSKDTNDDNIHEKGNGSPLVCS